MSDHDARALRDLGLRVTPQRRAILEAFTGRVDEHLSADEVHARAASRVPEISRGTVYATLAELTEHGLLAALGAPEPVRYETNTAPHSHFRCRLCLRQFDIELAAPDVRTLTRLGYAVEHTAVTAEGVCTDCEGYDRGLRAGASAIHDHAQLEAVAGVATVRHETSLGSLML